MKRFYLLLLFAVVCFTSYANYAANVFTNPFQSDSVSVCVDELPYSWRGKSCLGQGTYYDTVPHEEDTTVYVLQLTVINTISKPIVTPSFQINCRNTQPGSLRASLSFDSRDSVSYQWYVSYDGLIWNPLSGETSDTYQPAPDVVDRYFKVSATSVKGCGMKYSDSVQVFVYSTLQASSISLNGNPSIVCRNTQTANQLIGSAASGGSGDYSYQWQKSDLTATDWTDVSGQTTINLPAGQTISQKTYFRRLDIDISCHDTIPTNEICIDVYQSPTKPVLAPYTDTVCYDSIPNQLSIATQSTGYSSVDSVIYHWEYSVDGINFYSLSYSGLTYTPQSRLTAPKWYRVNAVLQSECDSIYSDTIKVNVYNPLDIQVVAGDTTVCYMTSAELSVLASGVDHRYSYVWYESSDASSFGTQVGTNSSLNTTPNTDGTRYYRCVVTSTKGCGSDTSDMITVVTRTQFQAGEIDINGNPAIVCRNNQTANPLTGSAASGGSGNYSYQWQKSDITGTNWYDIAGKTSINLPAGQTISQQTSFRRIDKDNTCNVYDTTNVITIDVYKSPTKPILTPYTDTICYNTSHNQLSIETQSTGYSSVDSVIYQWEYSDNNVNFYSLNATGITYTPQSGLTAPKWYRVNAVLQSKCDSIYSDPIKVNVYNPLDVQVILGDDTVCYMTQACLSVSASGVDNRYSYQWYESQNVTSIGTQVGTNYPVLNTSKHTAGTLYYRCIVSSIKGCGSDTSDVITVVTRPEFRAGNISLRVDSIVCRNSPVVNPFSSLSAASGGSGRYSYQWEYRTNGEWTPISGETQLTLSGFTIEDLTYFRRSDIDAVCNDTKYTDAISIDIYRGLTKPILSSYMETVCYDSVPKGQLSMDSLSTPISSEDSVVYSWEYTSDLSAAFQPLGCSDTIYQFDRALKDTTYYRVVAKLYSDCGTEISNTVRVCVYRPLRVSKISSDTAVCYNTSATLRVKASGVDNRYNYQWYSSTTAAGNWSPISGATSAVYSTEPQISADTLYYKCHVTSICGCGEVWTDTPFAVETKSVLSPGEIKINGKDTICFNSNDYQIVSKVPSSGSFTDENHYLWQKADGLSGNNWVTINNETSASLNTSIYLRQTTRFRRVAWNSVCEPNGKPSNEVIIYVRDAVIAPVITPIPVSDSICYGGSHLLTMRIRPLDGTLGEHFTFKWYESETTQRPVASVDTGETYNLQNLTKDHYYWVEAVSSRGCGNVFSDSVHIHVMDSLSVTIQGKTTTLCFNEGETLTATASGSKTGNHYHYTWQQQLVDEYGAEGEWEPVPNSSDSPNLTTPKRTGGESYNYRCIVANDFCNSESDTSNVMRLNTYKDIVTGALKPLDGIGYCYGDRVGVLEFATQPTGDHEIITWQYRNKNNYVWKDMKKSSSDTLIYDPIIFSQQWNDTVFVRAMLSNPCENDSTPEIIVCINPLPEQKTIHCDNSKVCSNEPTKYYIAEGDFSSRYYYKWDIDEAIGRIMNNNDSSREVEIMWNSALQDAKVSLTITDTAPSQCSTSYYSSGIKVDEGVDTVAIYRKRNSNILYVSDSSYTSYYYQWQRYPNGKSSSESEEVAYAQGKRYIVLDDLESDLKNYTYGLKLTSKPKEITDQCSSYSRYWGKSDGDDVAKIHQSRIYASTHIRDVILLRIENPDKLPTFISIYSVSGTLIYTNSFGNDEFIEEELPMTLVSGVYLLCVTVGDEVSTIKLMAE